MEPSTTWEIPRLSASAVLEHKKESSLAAQLLQSAAYSGAEAPVRALAQAADHCTGAHADAAVQSGFKAIGVEPVRPAEFGSSRWLVQQVGGAAGMMVPFLALRSAVKSDAAGLLGEEALLNSESQTLGQVALREAALSGTTGLLYGSLLTPSKESNVGKSAFLADRLKTGLADAASFAALSAASPYIARGFESTAAALDGSTVLPTMVKTPLSAALKFPLVTGMASGVPSGIICAEANALKDGRLLASRQEFKESMGSMAAVGGTMGLGSWLLERAAKGSEPDGGSMQREQVQRELLQRQEMKHEAMQHEAMQHEALKHEAMDRTTELTGRESVEQSPVTERTARESKQTALNPESKPETTIEAIVKKSTDRITEDKPGAATKEGAPRIPGDDVQDLIDRSAIKLQGVAGKNIKETEEVPVITKPGDSNLATDPSLPGVDIVLGASGAETSAHVGFLKAIEDNHVPVGRITGVSGGSLVATLFANKYSADQIKDILLSDDFRHPSLDMMGRMYHVCDPWNLFPYMIDFKPWLQDFVEKYNLKPQENLRIVAADAETHAPMVFEGTNYDLTTALTASTDATPALGLKPIQVDGRTAVDGFYYHPNPTALCKSPAIASKIGFTSELPHELLAPWDYFMHFQELVKHDDYIRDFPDPPGHVISTTGLPDVAMSTFSISKATVERLIDHGYAATMERLKQPDATKVIQEAQKAAEHN